LNNNRSYESTMIEYKNITIN